MAWFTNSITQVNHENKVRTPYAPGHKVQQNANNEVQNMYPSQPANSGFRPTFKPNDERHIWSRPMQYNAKKPPFNKEEKPQYPKPAYAYRPYMPRSEEKPNYQKPYKEGDQTKINIPCKFFQSGSCVNPNCKFLHEKATAEQSDFHHSKTKRYEDERPKEIKQKETFDKKPYAKPTHNQFQKYNKREHENQYEEEEKEEEEEGDEENEEYDEEEEEEEEEEYHSAPKKHYERDMEKDKVSKAMPERVIKVKKDNQEKEIILHKKQEHKNVAFQEDIVQQQKINHRREMQKEEEKVEYTSKPTPEVKQNIKDSKALLGRCMQMCSLEEITNREQIGDYSIFEVDLKEYNPESKVNKIHPNLAIKKYERSDAGKVMDNAETVRPPSVIP